MTQISLVLNLSTRYPSEENGLKLGQFISLFDNRVLQDPYQRWIQGRKILDLKYGSSNPI